MDFVRKTMFSSLPNNKILDLSKLKAFSDDIYCHEKLEICFSWDIKHWWKRRKCWLPASPSFPTMFSKAFFYGFVEKMKFKAMPN